MTDMAYPSAKPRNPHTNIMPDGRPAPKLMIRFVCPRCFRFAVRDAYRGPVSCASAHIQTFCEPMVME